MKQTTYYYSDEVNDDFAGNNLKKAEIPADYEYLNRGFWQQLRRFFVRIILMYPIMFVYTKFIKRVTFKDKKKMKGYKKQGAFIYGNHTAVALEACSPNYLACPRPADIVLSTEAYSIKGIKGILKGLGALPVPESFRGMTKFNAALKEAIEKKHWIAIYPEAHIWPYYTKIRPFPTTSFTYPVKLDTPVFTYTMTYTKRKFSKYPKRTVYVDGPFFADKTLPLKAATQKLRDEVYAAMSERAKLSNYEYIKYVYRPKEEEEAAE